MRVLILQHPQEPHVEIGTAPLLVEMLPDCQLKTGLSWRNLSAAVGAEVVTSEWAVLYLGSGVKGEPSTPKSLLTFVDKKGLSRDRPAKLKGLVVIDGTWSQAKTLWWRNAWLLKLHRMILNPTTPSRYGKMRKEPRRECLSTLESVGLALTALGEPPQTEANLLQAFEKFLQTKK